MAKRKQEEILIEPGSGNVFADLGFENADELLAKAQLVRAISKAMVDQGVNQTALAEMLGIDQSKVSKLLRGVTEGFSSDRLLRILTGLNQDIEIIIRPKLEASNAKPMFPWRLCKSFKGALNPLQYSFNLTLPVNYCP